MNIYINMLLFICIYIIYYHTEYQNDLDQIHLIIEYDNDQFNYRIPFKNELIRNCSNNCAT